MTTLIRYWRRQSWKVHAFLASLFWGGVAGLLVVWPALSSVVPLPVYIGGMVVLSAALAAAKYFDRPGTE